MAVSPFRISVGKSNIRVADNTAAGELGRELRKAFDEVADNFKFFTDHLANMSPEIAVDGADI